MALSGNWSSEACVYTALHGGYGIFYCAKNLLFPYQNFQQMSSLGSQIFLFMGLAICFYSIPFYHIYIAKDSSPTSAQIMVGSILCVLGCLIEFCADVQKEITLSLKRGLITNGFFAYSRNANYFGDSMNYVGLILIASHGTHFYIPQLGFLFLFFQIMLPLMILKDVSISRYPGWDNYYKQSGFFFPNIGSMMSDCMGNKN